MPSCLPQAPPLPWGSEQSTQGLALPRCRGLAGIVKSGWTISYISGKPGSGCEDVGQQEVPWNSEDSAVGGPWGCAEGQEGGKGVWGAWQS